MHTMPDVIEKNPKIFNGKPIIRDTRIPVSRVLALIGMEYTLNQLKKELPDLSGLTEEDITTILSYHQKRYGQKTSKNS